ncbi:MAG: FAD-binding protein [Euryarchaeota archaeon]|jgi:L-aspartate oxidase|nr:FAD-binding protein [Euryarchaeota archaeon]MBT3970830.1 FAD-binding protein [Euryarchaeota archaeon]MBT4406698.1 FAD-binding protein [Euryarchaeota archaeon]MBT6644761.1 FAD-binding protein [Euryarchaeota archaeon]
MPSAIIVGSGIAGLFAAISCADAGWNVQIVTKSDPSDSSTNFAQGGIAGILDKTDGVGIESHIADTLKSGDGHCDEAVVRGIVEEAGDRIRDLLNIGVKFDEKDGGGFDLAKEGGHTSHRILHSKDATGAEIERALMQAIENNSNISLLSNHLVVDLILEDNEAEAHDIVGIWCLDLDAEEMHTMAADAIILATGGAGQLYSHTTNPLVATADGAAMAIRAGAAVKDMAFIQFHPTALATPSLTRAFLITEALRGYGAVLLDIETHKKWKVGSSAKAGRGDIKDPSALSFTLKHSPLGSLATRDIVARAIDSELKMSGEDFVYLATEHLVHDDLHKSFPMIAEYLKTIGLELGVDPLPVSPAAHYFVGGLEVDHVGRVKQKGIHHYMGRLFAIGEVACTGMHGANRLASNSLLEAVVYAQRAAKYAIENPPADGKEVDAIDLPRWRADKLSTLREHGHLRHDREAIQATMTHDVGIVKRDYRLQRASRRLALLSDEVGRIWQRCKPTRDLVELRNLILIAKEVCYASIAMKENIGLHWNDDLI